MPHAFGKSFLSVTFVVVVLCFVIFGGGMDPVKTEIGLKHYAERKSKVMQLVLPTWMKMPLNTFVNVLYLAIGAYWCVVICDYQKNKRMLEQDIIMFHTFNIMTCFYAPIQMMRIIINSHRFAVLDQWVTIPFFMWVFIWSFTILNDFNIYVCFFLTCLSLCSYVLALYSTFGFEISLTLHIAVAIIGASLVFKRYGTKESRNAFLLALLSCAGFVILKLLDLYLPSLHPIFTKISGHFLSKIADAFQIHFVNKFFFAVWEEKHKSKDRKKA